MNGTETRINSGRLVQLDWPKYFFQLVLISASLLFLFFIILMKSRSTAEFNVEPMLFVYTIFVTVFQLSRLVAAMFYKKSFKGTVLQGAVASEALGSEYLNHGSFPATYEPAVTFIIPCKNEERVIAATVENCFRAQYPGEKLEVIVINDGSTDSTAAVLETLKSKFSALTIVHWKENRGKKHAMAEGFRRAKGEILIQLDSDSFIEPRTFKNLVKPFQNPRIGAVSAHTDPLNADKNFLTRMQSAYYFASFRILKAAESSFLTVLCCSGCASAYRKSAVLPLLEEWLEEKFLGRPVPWGDDRSLTTRVLKAGYRTVYSNEVQAYTIVPDTLKQLVKQQIRWKKSWFVNALFTGKFIWKTQPFVAFTYFFPLVAVSFLSPFMAGRALFYLPFASGALPLYHVAGVVLLAAIFAAYYKMVSPKNKYWIYLFPWSVFNLFFLSFLTVYAVIRIQDRGWGTR